MEEIKNELLKFESCLKEYCRPMFDRLQKPLAEEQLSQIHDQQLIEMFRWKNGIEYDDNLPTSAFGFCEFGVMPSLAYANEIIRLKNGKFWKTSYFPVILSFGGDFLLYESDKNADDYGKIFLYSPNLGYVYDLPSIYDSLLLMLRTIRECFEKRAIWYDKNISFLETDYKLEAQISSSLNPKSEYWKG